VSNNLYLDLMKRCLVNEIYSETEPHISAGNRIEGNGPRPPIAHTMIGLKRLDNIQFCAETVIREGIHGNFLEAGVWRGGACIFMQAILKAYKEDFRTVWVADSFCGLPKPDVDKYPFDNGYNFYLENNLKISLEQVKSNFDKYGLLCENVKFLKGWFKDTFPTVPIKNLALLRLDGDLYESTMDTLVNLYPKVSGGGFVIIDDYNNIEPCKRAVDDYRRKENITIPISEVDFTGVYWRKI